MSIKKSELKDIVTIELKKQLKEENKTIRYLEDNGLELCADWLEGEILDRNLQISQNEKTEYIDYMIKVFYGKIDEILNLL
ncbi:hypothetical protein BX659_1564 [Orenia metallireducens]|uniref:Uncharacterized protein n=1 Tax=Orenia metallireducens TaxID=1413210 RepID=A0A285II76_9FIRM|nr:hypothetical protein [Orenia metallireducens]PRX17200.1 hypothetical protein BX659_1564 [Orenia metallireducens]SNY47685.1 hypothetical protein SAMN06265827_1562 [Orenia metallireducens]